MKKFSFVVTGLLCCASAAVADDFKPLDSTPMKTFEAPTLQTMKPFPTKDDGSEAVTEAPVPKLLNAGEAAAAEAKEAETKGWISFSSPVNAIRHSDRTEIMFRNGESYYLPSGSKHNVFYTICEESEKNGQAVKVTANPNSRTIVQLSGGAGAPKQK